MIIMSLFFCIDFLFEQCYTIINNKLILFGKNQQKRGGVNMLRVKEKISINAIVVFSFVFISFILISLIPSYTASAASSIRIGVSSSINSQYQGAKITVNATGSGGTAPYNYKFIYKVNNGGWTTAKNYNTSNTCSFIASKAGNYTVRSFAKDKNNREVYCDIKINIKEKYVSPSNNSTISSTRIYRYGIVRVKGIGNGGTKPYSFKYYYTDQYGNTKFVKDYSSASSVDIKFYYGGYYTVHCTMKDKDGKVLDKAFEVTVNYNTGEAIKNGSSLSSSSVFLGSTITLNGKAFGGSQPYQYVYYYSLNGSAYKKINGYIKSGKQTFKPSATGYYKIKISAKDYNGKNTDIVKDLIVKKNTNKALSLTSSLNTTSLVDQNTTVTINASGNGGTMPYKYAYYYKLANGTWKTIKDYSTSEKVTLKLSSKGLYTIKSVVRDEAGKKLEKTTSVTSIAKITEDSISASVKHPYGLTAAYTLKDAGRGAKYEVYFRNPGSTQWVKVQSSSENRLIKVRPRYLGVTSYIVYTKYNNKTTISSFKITTYIPQSVTSELAIINAERKKVGLNSLKLDNNLVFVANVRAEELEKSYSHNRPDGSKCFSVLEEYGIKTPSSSGENIAWGYPDEKSVMNGWMNSKNHRENILSSKFNKIGIGIYNKYWTQMFTS